MARVQPILIVDGDSAMRETLREQLTRDGAFSVVEAGSAQEAEAWLGLAGARCAAVIMDAMLPDADGHAVRARLRANGLSMPIILVNGQDAAHEHLRLATVGGVVTVSMHFEPRLEVWVMPSLNVTDKAGVLPVFSIERL